MNARHLLLIFLLVTGVLVLCTWHPGDTPSSYSKTERTCFPVLSGNKWGYIDALGQLTIPFDFYAAGDFSEGLAAVRRDGLYGYIDTTGAIAVAEKFDYAEGFKYGKARVYINARPYYIDHSGQLLFEHDYLEILDFGNHNYTVAVTESDKHCLIDSKGRMLTDTIFASIHEFSEGKATGFLLTSFRGDDELLEWDTNYRACVIDTTGNMKINPGSYTRIGRFSEGKAFAERLYQDSVGRWQEQEAEFINTQGEVLFSVKDAPYSVPWYGLFSDDKLIVDIWDSARTESWPGVIDENGHLLFADESLTEITPYDAGVAFGRVKESINWILIDESGKQINPAVYEDIYDHQRSFSSTLMIFEHGKALVRKAYQWYMIDHTGKQVDTLSTEVSMLRAEYFDGHTVVFVDTASLLYFVDEHRYLPGEYTGIAAGTVHDQLIRVGFQGEEEEWGYVNRTGVVVWRSESVSQADPSPLNIDYMNRGYFFASMFLDPSDRNGGWWESANFYRSLDSAQFSYTSDQFTIFLDTTENVECESGVQGYRAYVVNDRNDSIRFPAEDSRIEMKLQATDNAGAWRDIEYLPGSWCGNSYHTLFLPPQHYWQFEIPEYEGVQQTRIRAELTYYNYEIEGWEEKEVYSNEINGSINPAQFWRKREYVSNGIMDPYTE